MYLFTSLALLELGELWISSFCNWVIIELSTGINDNACAHWVKPKINSCDQELFSRLSCTSNLKHFFKLFNTLLYSFIYNNNNNEPYVRSWKTGRLWTQFMDRNNNLEALSQIKCRFKYAYLGLGDWNGKLTLTDGITSSEISKTLLLCTSTSYDESVPLEFC